MLLIPVGCIFWLCISSTWGFWRATGIFIATIGWTTVAVALMYEGAKKLS